MLLLQAPIAFAMMGEWRKDPNKIFIGSLMAGLIKPQVQAMLSELGLQPDDVIMPCQKQGTLTIAFAIFSDPGDCQHAINTLDGLVWSKWAPGTIKAQRGDPSQGGL